MIKFADGLKLEAIIYSDESQVKVGATAGSPLVIESIVVSMQNGQMADVPWAEITYSNGTTYLDNLSCLGVASVKILKEPGE